MSAFHRDRHLYAVIGDPIGHSLSPTIHHQIYQYQGLNHAYIPLRIPENELEAGVSLLKKNFHGFNVTIPHKQRIIPFLDELDPRAEIYGAVNTVKVEKGKLIGYNTDGYGFVKSLEVHNLSMTGKRVLILGAGGAARVVAYELLVLGAKVTIANRSLSKAEALKGDLEAHFGEGILEVVSSQDIQGKFEVIINTTPLGMAPREGELPVGEHLIQRAELLYDLIYRPFTTKFLKTGEKYGCNCMNGLLMLLFQGIKAHEIWTGKTVKPGVQQAIYQVLLEALEEE